MKDTFKAYLAQQKADNKYMTAPSKELLGEGIFDNRKYDCYLNLHLNHFIWEYECQDNEANAIDACFIEYLGPNVPQNKTDIVTGKSYGDFSLSYSNGSK